MLMVTLKSKIRKTEKLKIFKTVTETIPTAIVFKLLKLKMILNLTAIEETKTMRVYKPKMVKICQVTKKMTLRPDPKTT